MTGIRREPGRSVVHKVVGILRAFKSARRQLTLHEIATLVGLPPPTALRLARELVDAGALERTSNGSYRIGLSAWQTGELSVPTHKLRESASPVMMDLCSNLGAGALAVIFSDHQAIVVEKMGFTKDWPVESKPFVAEALPLHASASGKLLLATLPRDEREILIHRKLIRYTTRTIVDPGTLQSELELIARQAYALSAGEFRNNLFAIATGIHAPDGTVIGSLVAATQKSAAEATRMLTPLQRATSAIEARLSSFGNF